MVKIDCIFFSHRIYIKTTADFHPIFQLFRIYTFAFGFYHQRAPLSRFNLHLQISIKGTILDLGHSCSFSMRVTMLSLKYAVTLPDSFVSLNIAAPSLMSRIDCSFISPPRSPTLPPSYAVPRPHNCKNSP